MFDHFVILALKGLRTVFMRTTLYRLLFNKCAYQVKSVKRGNEKKYIGKNRKTNILDWRVYLQKYIVDISHRRVRNFQNMCFQEYRRIWKNLIQDDERHNRRLRVGLDGKSSQEYPVNPGFT